jgi:hypothetical protein
MGHKITNVALILKFGILFIVLGQISLWAVSWDILKGPRLFGHDPKIVPRYTMENLGAKKFRSPQNIP